MDLASARSRHSAFILKYLGSLTIVGDPRVDHAFFKLNLCRDLLAGFRHYLHSAA